MNQAKKDRLDLAILQYACSSDIARNIEKSLNLTRQAVDGGARLILLPELFNTPYFCRNVNPDYFEWALPRDDSFFQRFADIARDNGVVLVIPYFEKRAEGLYHNSLKVLDADGTEAGHYRKMHIPDDPGFYEKYYFTPGENDFDVIKTRHITLGALICWDQWFPEAARICAIKGAELLIYPSAIGTLPEETGDLGKEYLAAWQTVQCSHAIANGCFVAAANRVGQEGDITFWGHSFVAGPFGKKIDEADSEEMVMHSSLDISEIEHTRRMWPFFRDRRIDKYEDINHRYIDSGR